MTCRWSTSSSSDDECNNGFSSASTLKIACRKRQSRRSLPSSNQRAIIMEAKKNCTHKEGVIATNVTTRNHFHPVEKSDLKLVLRREKSKIDRKHVAQNSSQSRFLKRRKQKRFYKNINLTSSAEFSPKRWKWHKSAAFSKSNETSTKGQLKTSHRTDSQCPMSKHPSSDDHQQSENVTKADKASGSSQRRGLSDENHWKDSKEIELEIGTCKR